jgi:hypothetical protein
VTIRVDCPKCDRPHDLADHQVGWFVRCGCCGETFTSQAPESAHAERRRPEPLDPELYGVAWVLVVYATGLLAWLLWVHFPLWALVLPPCAGGVAVVLLLMGKCGVGKPTSENFTRVKCGMDASEVVALLGPVGACEALPNDPDSPSAREPWKARGMVLEWQGIDVLYRVVFFDGTVRCAFVTAGRRHILTPQVGEGQPAQTAPSQHQERADEPEPVAQARPPDQGTLDAFGKLRQGMNEGEVVALLGPPTRRHAVPPRQLEDGESPASVFLVWGQLSGDHVHVTLLADKLAVGRCSVQGQRLELPR